MEPTNTTAAQREIRGSAFGYTLACVIGRHGVFLPWHRGRELDELAFADRDDRWLFDSLIEGKEAKEAERLRFAFLRHEYRRDRSRFLLNWVMIELEGDAASRNAGHLVDSWCWFRCVGQAYSIRRAMFDNHDWLLSATTPLPRKPRQALISIPTIGWRRLFGYPLLPRRSGVELAFETSQVRRITGQLADFTMFGDGFRIRFGNRVEFAPESVYRRANEGLIQSRADA